MYIYIYIYIYIIYIYIYMLTDTYITHTHTYVGGLSYSQSITMYTWCRMIHDDTPRHIGDHEAH